MPNCSLIVPTVMAAAICLGAGGAAATDPTVLKVAVSANGDGTYTFSTTLKHPDTGWDHYADGWSVVNRSGKVLGDRVLYHPHVNEQPFTRSLGRVAIPAGTTEVFVRARCKVSGEAEQLFSVKLP
jgi:hypothetical protein